MQRVKSFLNKKRRLAVVGLAVALVALGGVWYWGDGANAAEYMTARVERNAEGEIARSVRFAVDCDEGARHLLGEREREPWDPLLESIAGGTEQLLHVGCFGASAKQLGKTRDTPSPQCPESDAYACAVTGQVTGFQKSAGRRRGLGL